MRVDRGKALRRWQTGATTSMTRGTCEADETTRFFLAVHPSL